VSEPLQAATRRAVSATSIDVIRVFILDLMTLAPALL
jgi:hypothetical protein